MPAQKEFQRQYLIVVVAVVLLVLIAIYVGYGWFTKASTPASSFAPLANSGRGTTTVESKKYSSDLQAYNQKNADQALQHGGTYVSSLSTAESPVSQPTTGNESKPPVQTDRSAPQAGSSNTAAAYAYAPPASTASHYLTPDETKAIQAMIKQWAGVNTANEAGYSAGITKATVDQEETYAASMDQAAGEGLRVTSNNTANGATVMEALRQQVIVAPYAITYAQLKTEIDTDESSVVRAVVPEGMPYAGAVLYATGYKRLENDVDMTFDAMVYGGRAFKVTAKPLDLKSSRTALSGDVHHHYFARIVLPALANGIGNTAQMFATAGAQNIVTSQGGVISTNPTTPSVRNIAGTFVGGAGQSAGQVLSQEAAQIPVKQTIVPKDEMIGIQFIGSVTAADDMSLTNADSKPQQAAPARAASTSVPPITPPRPSPNVALPGGMRYTALPVTSAVGGL